MPKNPVPFGGILRWTPTLQMYSLFRCWYRSHPIQSRRFAEFLLSPGLPVYLFPLPATGKNLRTCFPTAGSVPMSFFHDRLTLGYSAVSYPLPSLLQGLGSTARSLLP